MTRQQMLANMSALELAEWRALYRLESEETMRAGIDREAAATVDRIMRRSA